MPRRSTWLKSQRRTVASADADASSVPSGLKAAAQTAPAWPLSTAMHWGYGSAAAALYGVVAGSLREPSPLYGLPFGAAVWAAGYVVLPEAGIYKPIWE